MHDPLRQSIPLEKLCVGMFVVELDVPWINSPFLTHARRIKSFKDIDALRRSGVKNLVIDLTKGDSPKLSEQNTGMVETDQIVTETSQLDGPTELQGPRLDEVLKQPTADQEMAAAKEVRNQVLRVVATLFNAIESGKTVATEEVNPLVEQTIASLKRNNQALMSLMHLSRKSQKLADHAFSTYCVALTIGVRLKIALADLQMLGLAALLHDSGWLQLPLNLMGKRSRYTLSELALMQQHVQLTHKILQFSALPKLVYRIIAEHHERNDGGGYPAGLKTSRIHPLSQILAVADSYDEYVHQLQDGPGMMPRLALQTLYKETKSGRFSTEVVTAFISMMGVYPVTSVVLLETLEKAVVLEHNQAAHTTTIRILYDESGKPLKTPITAILPQNDNPQRIIKTLLDPTDSRNDPFGILGAGNWE
jgi:HD-GYP domain-containing protein (c-di-GMP phosphodiesterase class II)